jgi:hypothetical protein
MRLSPVIAVLVAIALSGSTIEMATAAAPIPAPWQVTGAVKLNKGDLKRVEKSSKKGAFVQCGLVPSKRFPKGLWVPGSLVDAGQKRAWFLPLLTEANNLRRQSLLLKKTGKGTAAATLLRRASDKKARYTKDRNTCGTLNNKTIGSAAPSAGNSGSAGSGASARIWFDKTVRWVPFTRTRSACVSTPNPNSDLRFSVCGREGIVKSGSARRGRFNTRTGSSNVLTFDSTGSLQEAVSQGNISVSTFAVGPTGWTYMGLGSPVSVPGSAGSVSCSFIRVREATGVPECVDENVTAVAEIQFDDTGGVVYRGSNGSSTVLRRESAGAVSNLITSSATIEHFAAMADGSVVMSGRTNSSSGWVRWVDTDGVLRNIFSNNSATFVKLFPDGNVYFGIWSTSNRMGINRFLFESKTLDSNMWLSGNTNGQQVTSYFGAAEICDFTQVQTAFCGFYGTFVSSWHVTQSGQVIAVSDCGGGCSIPRLMQYWPEVKYLSTAVTSVGHLAPAGAKFAISGTNDTGQNILTLYDPAADSERLLIGASQETEIYHLAYSSSTDEIYFDGLRFSNNSYVMGKVSATTGQLTYLTTTNISFEDFQAF